MNPIHTLINDTLALDEKATAQSPVQRLMKAKFNRHIKRHGLSFARIAKIAVEALEDAPHDLLCPAAPPSPSIYKGCDCWKSRALAAIGEAGK